MRGGSEGAGQHLCQETAGRRSRSVPIRLNQTRATGHQGTTVLEFCRNSLDDRKRLGIAGERQRPQIGTRILVRVEQDRTIGDQPISIAFRESR